MNLTMITVLTLLTVHFVADFLFQSDWMAVNKSKNWRALTCHVAVYSLPFLIIFGWQFGLITFVTHWLTDWITSRITSKLWFFKQNFPEINEWYYVQGRRHWFFVVIGLDQLIHTYSLLLTLLWLQPYGRM